MILSERQEDILKRIIKEYICQAEPVGSDYLKRKYKSDLSPATIRGEMQKLTDMGYLEQPHTSSGRIPADKGYRYLVDFLIAEEIGDLINKKIAQEIERIKEIDDCLLFLRGINRILTASSSGLAFSYFPEEDFCLTEGWGHVFKDPEFSDVKYTRNFLSMIEALEKNIEHFDIADFTIKVYIGREIPMPRYRDFSIVISKCLFRKKETVLAIAGPKRMPYRKNIPLVNSVIKILEKNGL